MGWNSAFCDAMQPADGDVVVKGKKGLDAFPDTDLEAQLVHHQIETVVLGGFLTNCCVESTMRTAYEKGFNVITLTDAMATTSTEGQAVTGGSFGMFSTPMTVADYEAKLAVSAGGSVDQESGGAKEEPKRRAGRFSRMFSRRSSSETAAAAGA